MPLTIEAVSTEQIAVFCQQNGIQRLALFGSALRDDFRPDSDIDLLVAFTPDKQVGLLEVARLEFELGDIFGRKVDLRTADDLSRYFRDAVIAEARVLYADEV